MKSLRKIIIKNKNSDFLILLKDILKWEKKRVDKNFIKNSYFEDINSRFGIFPKTKLYPMYFYGDIENPKDKYVFMGINPSYTGKMEKQEYKDEKISFNNYYDFLNNAFLKWKKKRYYNDKLFNYLKRNISLYLNERYNIDKKDINYEWLQKNVVNLEFLPYHSKSANGLVINDINDYFETYFVVLEKFIKYLNPQKEIVIFGFPKIIELLKLDKNKKIEFHKNGKIYQGKLFGYDFIGLNFRFSGEHLKLL